MEWNSAEALQTDLSKEVKLCLANHVSVRENLVGLQWFGELNICVLAETT